MKDIEQIIEDAKKAGVDMSWLREAQQKQVQSPKGMSPGAGTLLEAMRTDQASRPAYQPRPPGTPTLQREAHDEGARQFEENMGFNIRKFEEGMGFDREKMALDERYRRDKLAQQMAIAGMSGSGGVTGGVGTGETARMDPGTLRSLSSMTDTPMTWDVNRPPKQIQAAAMDEVMGEMDPMEQVRSLVQFVIEDGGTWTDIQNAIDRQEPMLRQQKVSMSEALNWAMSEYERLIGGAQPNRFQDSFLGGFAPDPNLMSLGKDKSSAFNRSIRDPFHEALQKRYIDFNVPLDDRLYGKD